MKFKKFLSVLLALSIVASCMAVAGTVFASGAETEVAESAYEEMLAETSADAGYGLSSTVNDGTILQAWSWSFANIDAKLEQIAEQGFTTVQVSPPNEIKKGTSGAKFLQSDNKNGWWMFYQPAGFQLNQSTDNALGTKAQFVAMCEHAHQLGVKIIVDAVINHMGTKEGDDSNTSTDPMSHVTPKAAQFEPEIYNNKLFHTPWAQMTYKEDPNQFSPYDSTYDLTRNCTSGLPDLKTEDSRVQTAIFDYMDELISSGADGFRFDAAKHIETPDDISSLKSDFWTNTLRAVQNKYSDKEIYAYGEILNNCGVSRPFSMYTKLMDVTDSSSYWGIKDAVTSGGGNATPYYPNTNFTSSNTVLWDESHDTYVDGSTTNLNTTQRGKIWALVAGRSGISCVYLARPSDDTNTNSLYNITLGTANNTSWSNATTKAVNQFHNFYIGQSEYCTANSGGTAYIERGTTGAVIVNLGGTTTKSVSLANHKLTNGTYVDTITGNTFTVSGGKIAGQVGSTGVATIYKDDVLNPPTEAPTEPPITYILGDVDDDGEVSSIDATLILRYSIDLAEFDDKAMLAGDVDGDGYVSVIDATFIQRYLAEMPVKYDIGQEKSGTYNPNPTEPPVIPTTTQPTTVTPATVTPTTTQPTYNDGEEVTLYFSNNKGWDSVNVYMWSDLGGEAAEWPGVAATFVKNNDYGEGIYSVTVNTAQYDKVVFNGSAGQTADVDVYEAVAAGCGLYCLDTTDSEGHYNVGFYEYDPVNPTTTPIPPVPGDSGIYLVGTFNDWTPSASYQFTENSAAPGEYMLSTTLSEGVGVKVVKVADDSETYYPDGMDNEYVVDAAHAGAVTIYFKETYQADWAAFGGYMYIDNGSTPVDPDPTTAPTPGDSGIYLVGTFNDWTPSASYQFSENAAAPGEYMLSTTLSEGAGVKVVKVADDSETYYPDGMDNEYVVDAAHAGAVTIYFKETYQADWAAFGGYMYIDNGSTPVDPDPTTAPTPGDSGIYLVGTFNDWTPSASYQFSENAAAPGEYMLSTTLSEDAGVKVVKVADDSETYYPDGMDNEYVVDAAHAGAVTIYFKETYQADWAAFGGYMYIDNGSTPVDPDPTTAPTPGDSGIYLVGTFNDWTPSASYQFSENATAPGEYMLSTTLSEGAGVKVVKVADGAQTWYPDGMDNEYVVDAAHAGAVTIYFKETYQADWAAFGGYMYIDNGSVVPVDPTQGGNTDPTQGGNTDPTQGGGDGQTYTLYFSNNKYWSNVKVHMWTDGGATTTWPGNDADYVGINDIGETVYSATVNTSVYDHIIFNGSGGQTIDISVADAVAGGCGLYCLDTTNGQGHFNVAFYEYTGLGEGGNTDPTQGGGDDPQPGNMLYLNPGSNWSQANARFAAYFFGNGDKWVDMSSNGDGTYSVAVPDGYTSVIFVRMNPDTPANNWDNKWNQTSDLTISGNIGKTYYVTGWDYSGNWG